MIPVRARMHTTQAGQLPLTLSHRMAARRHVRGEPADSASSTAASARVWRRAVLPVLDQHGRRRQD
jgi:hypothetical protein